jgi:DNA-binding transcriptional ArsR family regulator/catechol 2,3-dioxygenase-like lactoylglutathione lyase family enzyme
MDEKAAVLALAALAQEARLRVFRALVGAGPQGMTPGAVAVLLDIPASTLSFHLKELANAGLVQAEREGRHLHYRPALAHMQALLGYLTDHCCRGQPCAPTRGRRRTPCWSGDITMKRFHVHLHVDDLARSIGFYSALFAAQPNRVEPDYAKWMLEDPRLNFAISTRGSRAGVDHLGFQVDDDGELAGLKQRAEAADAALLDEGATTCCYARSQKHWVTDPQGIAWEHFHTLGDIPVFREAANTADAAACCAPPAAVTRSTSVAQAGLPAARGRPVGIAVAPAKGCC